MTSGATNKVRWFVEVGGGFLGILLDSRVLKWTMFEMVLGDIDVLHRLYLALKPSHVGVDVDGLACPCTVLRPIAVK
jgi:hypothetical protein